MSQFGGRGPLILWTMWMFTIPSMIMVVLRLYTRFVLIRSPGVDDCVYTLAWVCCGRKPPRNRTDHVLIARS